MSVYAVGAALTATVGVIVLLFRFRSAERARGRFIRRPDPVIDDAWLEARVFSLLPEEVGAAWFEDVSSMQVVAVICRLAQGGRLRVELTPPASSWSSPGMRLRLLAPRSDFDGHVGKLLDALFVEGEQETSTEQIARRYGRRGGRVAEAMRQTLMERVAAHPGLDDIVPPPSGVRTWLLVLAATLAFAAGGQIEELAVVMFFLVVTSLGARSVAATIGRAMFCESWREWAVVVAVALWPTILGVAAVGIHDGDTPASPLRRASLLGVALASLALSSSVLNAARTRDGPRRLAWRWELERARGYFQRELHVSRRVPARWTPYLLSYGLGPEMRPPGVGNALDLASAERWSADATRVLSSVLRGPA